MKPVLVITGMHRSGTSLTASLFERAGVFLGERFEPPHPQNPRGFFEDLDFQELQREMLRAACPGEERGWPDWGWTESGRFNTAALESFRERARALVETRNARASRARAPWGWKDPRTSVLLDFWLPLLPEMRCLFVTRPPWEVADSLGRIPEDLFRKNPDFAPRIWTFYHQRLLAFAQAHPGRCTWIAAAQAVESPSGVMEKAVDALALPPALLEGARGAGQVVEPDLLRQSLPLESVEAFCRAYPESAALWQKVFHLTASTPALATH